MAKIPLRNIGSRGIMPDVPSWDLPIENATVAHNCRIVAGKLVSTNGHELVEVKSLDDSLRIIGANSNITPYRLGGWNTEALSVWAIVGQLDAQSDYRIWIFDGNDLREAGAGYITQNFKFNPLNTWLLAHNPDHPTQIVDQVTGNFQDLPGWDTYPDSPNWRAGNVVPFGPFLVAAPITVPTKKDFSVLWSDEIPPDIVSTEPIRWDYTNPASLSGENVLDPRAGKIITMLPLGQQLMIYCEYAVWSMTFTGGPLVFNFRQVFTDDGILNDRCVVALDRNTHMVIGKNNIYIHNGATKTFPAEGRTKQYFYGEIKAAQNAILHAQRWRNEAIVIYDVVENPTVFTKGLVYNYTYDSWTTIELPEITDMAEAPLPVDFTSWGELTRAWAEAFDPWRAKFAKGLDISIMVSPTNQKIYRDGTGTKYDDREIIALMRHERMDLDEVIEGKTNDRFMILRRMYPQIRGLGQISINVVGYAIPQPTTVYSTSALEEDGRRFNIGEDYKVDHIVTGRYLNLELRTVADSPDSYFMLSGIDMDVILDAYRE